MCHKHSIGVIFRLERVSSFIFWVLRPAIRIIDLSYLFKDVTDFG